MTPTLRSLQTIVPDTQLVQEEVRDVFAAQPDLGRLGQRIVGTSFDVSGIATRYTVIDELRLESRSDNPRFFDGEQNLLLSPGTKTRNELYIEAAGPLFVEAARRAIDGAEGITAADITHVVTVSCTGFFAPGPDFLVARELELRPGVQRYHLGFMGCYAAMPALRAAAQFCEADPEAVVLVVSVELCTLHLRTSNNPDTIVASSLFGDGAASGIVSNRDLAAGERGLKLDRFETVITPLGESDMAWTIGDEGFEMVLSTYVPQIIEQHVVDALRPLLADHEPLAAALEADTMSGAVEHWAIHPGGRSILDRVQHRLELTEKQLEPARGVLHDVGNMSSATVMFVMKRILHGESVPGERVIAMAFGPGLTVESALLEVAEG